MERGGRIRAWRALLPRYESSGHQLPGTDGFVVDCGPSAETPASTLMRELPDEAWCTLESPSDDVTQGKSPGASGALPPDIETRLRELVQLLYGLQQDLLDEAEGQEWGDTNLNAAAFRTSAEHVSRSRACLEHGLAEAGK